MSDRFQATRIDVRAVAIPSQHGMPSGCGGLSNGVRSTDSTPQYNASNTKNTVASENNSSQRRAPVTCAGFARAATGGDTGARLQLLERAGAFTDRLLQPLLRYPVAHADVHRAPLGCVLILRNDFLEYKRFAFGLPAHQPTQPLITSH